jgi:hypothetical protein
VPALSQGEESHSSPLSPWLKLMLAEIARKRDDLEEARAEQLRRANEADIVKSMQPPPPGV